MARPVTNWHQAPYFGWWFFRTIRNFLVQIIQNLCPYGTPSLPKVSWKKIPSRTPSRTFDMHGERHLCQKSSSTNSVTDFCHTWRSILVTHRAKTSSKDSVTNSVMGGFRHELRRRSFGMYGVAPIMSKDQYIYQTSKADISLNTWSREVI